MKGAVRMPSRPPHVRGTIPYAPASRPCASSMSTPRASHMTPTETRSTVIRGRQIESSRLMELPGALGIHDRKDRRHPAAIEHHAPPAGRILRGRRGSVRGAFETFNAHLQTGETFLERSNAAVQFRVRELDHRLRLGEAALHALFEIGPLAAQFLVHTGDGFGQKVEPFFEALDGTVEVAARLHVPGGTLLPHFVERAVDVLARLHVRGGILLPHRVEQAFQLLIRHQRHSTRRRPLLLRYLLEIASMRASGARAG